jgi:hypothetical protein
MPTGSLAEETVTRTRQPARGSGNTPPVLVPRAHIRAKTRSLRIVADLMERVLTNSHYDTLFMRPDLIEDDYYRFRNQPR